MLFGYPIKSVSENWLHDSLAAALHSIDELIKNNRSVPSWPGIIPESHRAKLKPKHGLKAKFDTYAAAFKALTPSDREKVIIALDKQNQIQKLLNNEENCDTISQLPESIQEPVRDLFGAGFSLLTAFEIRDRQYRIIYDSLPHHMCPFCGYEPFDSPKGPREALDHYLAESKYPFAAANLRNLVPMGEKCNKLKNADDVLWDNNGIRRQSFDPYTHKSVSVSLVNSVPFAGEDGEIPLWKIEFIPDTIEVKTWNEIFEIRKRYIDNVLDPSFKKWLNKFGAWFKKENGVSSITNNLLMSSLLDYIDLLDIMELSGPEFLRKNVFQMVYGYCKQGDARVISLISDCIAYQP